MKNKLYNISIIAVLVVAILLTLSACSLQKNKLYDINREPYTNNSIKFVTDKEKYSADDTVIRYSVTNISDEESGINSDSNCFELHKLVDGKWKRVGTKIDHFWTDAALILMPNQTETREIKLEDYFHLPLENGKYRIAVEGLVSNTFEIS